MWQKIRRIGLEIYCFITAPLVLRNCLGMTALIGLLLLIAGWWLQCYTRHGDSVQVPGYIGMNIKEAVRKAKSRNFQVAIADSIYVPGKAPGEVISQNPKAESRVKEGRTIYFTVAKNNPDIITLPDLVGSDDYDLYSKKASRLGLKPRISARVADPRLEPNTIVAIIYRGDTITQLIRNGYKVEMGATIDFVVSEQVTLTVSIPDCTCQTLDAAKFLITSSNLSVGEIHADATVTNPETAYVTQQRPKFDPNGVMRVGEQIELFITQEKPQRCQ